jgi:hypothetical protein
LCRIFFISSSWSPAHATKQGEEVGQVRSSIQEWLQTSRSAATRCSSSSARHHTAEELLEEGVRSVRREGDVLHQRGWYLRIRSKEECSPPMWGW